NWDGRRDSYLFGSCICFYSIYRILTLPRQNNTGHPIPPLLGLLPVRHHLSHQPVEALTVVVLRHMTEFMQYDVIDAFAWCLDQMRVQRDAAIRRAAAPLRLHGQNSQRGLRFYPQGLL